MAEDSKANGKTITWKAMEFTSGMMEESMKVNIEMTKKMDMEYTFGQMADNMKAIGSKVNNMV
jgi:hypothetical protein